MSQKATSLIDITNVFHPGELTEEQMDFYQPTAAVRGSDSYEFHDGLFQRVKTFQGDLHLLVVGHRGCGKSTELRILTTKLREESIPSITIEANSDMDIHGFSYIDIFILMVQRLVKYADEQNLKINNKILSAFQAALTTKTIQNFVERTQDVSLGAEVAVSVPFFLKLIGNIAASLKMGSGTREELRQEIKPQMMEIIAALNALLEDLKEQISSQNENKNIVIILDGLEQCTNECVRNLFTEDIAALDAINSHLIVVCPINIYRSADRAMLISHFSAYDVMPMIKVHNQDNTQYQEGIEVIKELILKRADHSFFNKGILEKIISMAGGSLRDTCYLLVNSAFEAYMNQKKTITMESVERTLNKYASDLFLSVEPKLFPGIKSLYDHDHRAMSNDTMVELLYGGIAFEYNGERWIDLHPLIRHYIDRHPEVLE